MSCDEENRFESLLRSLGARDATKTFLWDQSVKVVLHLLLIKEDKITPNWKRNSYLPADDCDILFKLRTHVHVRKSNNDDRLPFDWHFGLTLDSLLSPLKPKEVTPTTCTNSPASLLVYIRVLGLGNSRNLTKYPQFKIKPTKIFRDLVCRFFTKAVQE
jgi:hypothetical protein